MSDLIDEDYAILDEYRREARGVECSRCHITPFDYLDEAMMYGGWQEAFRFNKKRKKWYCIGCEISPL